MEQKLRFERFEFKYILGIETYKSIRRRLRHFLIPDPAVAGLSHGFYEVISLYYDSPRFYYYWEKIDGASKRKKIRLRTYRREGKVFSSDIFFEIKRKRDAVIIKDRFSLGTEGYKQFLSGSSAENLIAEDSHSRRVREEYLFEKSARCIAPKILVVYSREPYIGKYNKNLRITFDYGVKAKKSNDLFSLDKGLVNVSNADIIMELKFKWALPFYIEKLLKEYNLSRVPFSKYCNSVEACYSLSLLAMLANKNQSDSLNLKRVNLSTY